MEEDGLLTYKGRIYIPNVADLRRVVMDEIHQAPYSGHPGYQKTIATARKQYFWPGMKKDMAEYISRCMKCQQVKVAPTSSGFVAAFSSSGMEMGSYFHGFYYRIANDLETT